MISPQTELTKHFGNDKWDPCDLRELSLETLFVLQQQIILAIKYKTGAKTN
jgi:hypothetical protein